MPVYQAECAACGKQRDYFSTVKHRNRAVPRCCGKRMARVIVTAAYVSGDIPAYVSPTTGRVIGSRSARRDDLRRSSARPWEGIEQEQKEASRQRAYQDAKFDKSLTETAHKVWHEMPPAKRAVLDGSE